MTYAVRLIDCKANPFPALEVILLLHSGLYEPTYQVCRVLIYTMHFLDIPKIYTVCGSTQNQNNLVKQADQFVGSR